MAGAVLAAGLFAARDQLPLRLAIRDFHKAVTYRLGLPLPGTPDLARLDARLAAAEVKPGAAIFIRIFKLESQLELWMKRGDRFVLFATYPVCYWSGKLGPKLRQGDRQAPEGFYTVSAGQMNPASRWHRSFNLGFPNAFDRQHRRNGNFLMVHGGCSSIGCYAMTNPVIDEIWRLATAAHSAGQSAFAVHVFPFRPSTGRLASASALPAAPFWQELAPAYETFETTRVPPRIRVCRGQYAVSAGKAGSDGSEPVASGCTVSAGS